MSNAARIGDPTSGHGSFPPTMTAAGSGNVFINGKPAHRLGDGWIPHASPSPSPPHRDVLASGSGSVFINGAPAGRVGDSGSVGGTIVSGSSNVHIGG